MRRFGYPRAPRTSKAAAILLIVAGCQSEEPSDAQFMRMIVSSMHRMLMGDIKALNKAARDLQAAAPTPVGRGWDASDRDALDRMKVAWIATRSSWERTEGTLAILFPDLDESLDARYEDLLEAVGPAGDLNPFDGEGITGAHAIERILFAGEIPPVVEDYEATLPGYQVASWPGTEQQAAEIKTGLCARFVDDTQQLLERWEPLTIDLADAFQGLTGLMSSQKEKVGLAAAHQEESRYSQRTMEDLRFNLAGTRALYDLFTPWLGTKAFGTTLDSYVQMAFDRLQQTYDTVPGEAIPAPPATWSSHLPTVADEQSPFGILYVAVVQEVDATRPGSAVDAMNQVAKALGLPEYTGN